MSEASLGDTWVVVPLYNEATVITSVIEDLKMVFDKIVVVDDKSTDDGLFLLQSMPGIWILQHSVNLGQGAAIQTGIDYALSRNAKAIVTFDSDGQHRVEDAKAMALKLYSEGLDVVLGSRFLGVNSKTMPAAKRILLRFATVFERTVSGLNLTDAHNGLRVFSAEAAKELNLRQNRMAHASEITKKIAKAKLTFREVPVEIIYTDYTRAKGQRMSNSFNIIYELLSGSFLR